MIRILRTRRERTRKGTPNIFFSQYAATKEQFPLKSIKKKIGQAVGRQ
jgi:hypothetical protein